MYSDKSKLFEIISFNKTYKIRILPYTINIHDITTDKHYLYIYKNEWNYSFHVYTDKDELYDLFVNIFNNTNGCDKVLIYSKDNCQYYNYDTNDGDLKLVHQGEFSEISFFKIDAFEVRHNCDDMCNLYNNIIEMQKLLEKELNKLKLN